MEHMTVSDIVKATGGRLLRGDGELPVLHISIDSRVMRGNDLFVPLIGEKTDAHRFIRQAFAAGAVCTLTSEHEEGDIQPEQEAADGDTAATYAPAADVAADVPAAGVSATYTPAWIAVEDTRRALQAIGSYYRERLMLPLVGVTGSVGKTTTREMIAAALSAGYRVYKTPGNSNSQVGVPLTISEITLADEIGVLELGMSLPGEMTVIAQIARVDAAVITNIGLAHIEQLGSRENILREKLHIQDGLKPGGTLFVNGDDELLAHVSAKEGCRTYRYGTGADCDCRAEAIHFVDGCASFVAVCGGCRVPVRLGIMGRHHVGNALAALAVADHYGVDLYRAVQRLEAFKGFAGRQQTFECDGVTIIDDSYNASPASMRASLEVLFSMARAKRRIAVLADMKELGAEAPRYHREIGSWLAGQDLDCLLTMGSLAKEIADGAAENGAVFSRIHYDAGSQEALSTDLKELLRPGDCVLVKGSNSMRLGAVVSALRDR